MKEKLKLHQEENGCVHVTTEEGEPYIDVSVIAPELSFLLDEDQFFVREPSPQDLIAFLIKEDYLKCGASAEQYNHIKLLTCELTPKGLDCIENEKLIEYEN